MFFLFCVFMPQLYKYEAIHSLQEQEDRPGPGLACRPVSCLLLWAELRRARLHWSTAWWYAHPNGSCSWWGEAYTLSEKSEEVDSGSQQDPWGSGGQAILVPPNMPGDSWLHQGSLGLQRTRSGCFPKKGACMLLGPLCRQFERGSHSGSVGAPRGKSTKCG